MELKKAKLSGTTSESGLGLQHEAAMRVEARFLAEEKRRRHVQFVERLKTFFYLFLILFVGGGGFYVWRTGIFSAVRTAFRLEHSDAQQEPSKDSVVKPSAEVAVAPAQVMKDNLAFKQGEPNVDSPSKAEVLFADATLAYWKDATPADRPSKNGPPVDYTALVPDAKGGCVFLKISLAGDNSMKVRKIMRTREPVEVSRTEFNKMIEATPYLVMREGRAYYCSAGKPARQAGYAVPKKGEAFNPSRLEFGALYDQVLKAKLAKPAFRYDVFLDHAQFKKKLLVATVGFGEEVAHERFEAAARAAVDDDEAVAAMLAVGKAGFAPAK